MRWAGHVACVGEERGVYRVLGVGGEPEGKRPLGRPLHPMNFMAYGLYGRCNLAALIYTSVLG